MPSLVFATNNKHKLKEAKALLPSDINLLSLKDIGCEEELPETGITLEANAMQKARYVYEKFGMPCFADDTGLEVEALDGAPGVFSARYSGPNSDPAENNRKLLRELEGIADRRARFRTVIALFGVDSPRCFDGVIEGRISDVPVGEGGFGYDPLFIPSNYESTFAEMTMEQKNMMSHRGNALRLMAEWISNRFAQERERSA